MTSTQKQHNPINVNEALTALYNQALANGDNTLAYRVLQSLAKEAPPTFPPLETVSDEMLDHLLQTWCQQIDPQSEAGHDQSPPDPVCGDPSVAQQKGE